MAKLFIKDKFGIAPNSILYHNELSFKAKGLFTYLQSKPDGWKFSAERIAKESSDGINAVKSGLKELEELGFLKRVPRRKKDGKYIGFDYLLRLNTQKKPSVENPPTEKPPTENHTSFSKKYISNNIYILLLQKWNEKKIITHNAKGQIWDRIKKAINGRLREGYTQEDIEKAIENYSRILKGEEYYFKYKWSFHEFLQRGFEKFKDWEIAKNNYRRARIAEHQGLLVGFKPARSKRL